MWNGTLRVIIHPLQIKIWKDYCNIKYPKSMIAKDFYCFIIVTAASSNDDGVGKTKLNFKYTMERDGKRHGVIMQLSPQEFYKLLHEMDKVKGNLQSLTGGSNSEA